MLQASFGEHASAGSHLCPQRAEWRRVTQDWLLDQMDLLCCWRVKEGVGVAVGGGGFSLTKSEHVLVFAQALLYKNLWA